MIEGILFSFSFYFIVSYFHFFKLQLSLILLGKNCSLMTIDLEFIFVAIFKVLVQLVEQVQRCISNFNYNYLQTYLGFVVLCEYLAS